MKEVKQSPYLQWINHLSKVDRKALSDITHIEQKTFIHPQGDYSELNRYIEHFNSLMRQYYPSQVYSIHFDYSREADQEFLSVKDMPDNFYFHSQGASYQFMHDAQVHQKELIKLFQHMIHQIEYFHQDNPLLFEGRVSFFTLALRENSGGMPGIFLFPLGEFPKSIPYLQHLVERLHFFSPYSEIRIFLCSYPEDKQKFELKVRLHSSKSMGGHCLANSSVAIAADAMKLIHFDADVLDYYLELALQAFNEKINQLPDYQKAQNKVNLYYSLEDSLMVHQLQDNIDNPASLDVKI